jgi:hypothetical protein
LGEEKMKILTIFIVLSLILPSGFSISENNNYIKIANNNYSIFLSKFYPLIIINDSRGSIVFAITGIITNEGNYYQLFNISWERHFEEKNYLNYSLSSIDSDAKMSFNFIINSTSNSINILIILKISNFKGKSLGVVEHILKNLIQLRDIQNIDKNMDYEFNPMPEEKMNVKDNIHYILRNGTFYSNSNNTNSTNLMIFSPVNGSIATLISIITLPVYHNVSYSFPYLYSFIGIVIGISIIVSGAIILRKRS